MSFVAFGFGAAGKTSKVKELVNERTDGMCVSTRVAFTWRLQLGGIVKAAEGLRDCTNGRVYLRLIKSPYRK